VLFCEIDSFREAIHHLAATRTKSLGAVNGAPVRVTTKFSLMPAGVATWLKVAAVSLSPSGFKQGFDYLCLSKFSLVISRVVFVTACGGIHATRLNHP
jgi:hypothetical protein